MRLRLAILAALLTSASTDSFADPLSIATFQIDATPPLGSPLCDGLVTPAETIIDPLSCRGVVILGAGEPIVLCAIDWVGIGNSGYDAWREALARAAGTTPRRVAVHCLHQHDAPGCDFDAEDVLAAHGLAGTMFHVSFAHETIQRAADALRKALASPHQVTHLATGLGRVHEVASNRRVLGPDGKVKYVRYSATKIPEARAEPEGTIDPDVRLISFWNDERPLVALTYYATHPQSYYGQGNVSYDFPGMARAMRESAMPGVPLIHFDGAGGNVTAGKYNDGAPENRQILAERLAAGMKAAWDSAKKTSISSADVEWRTRDVALPLRADLADEAALERAIDDEKLPLKTRIGKARNLVWTRRTRARHKIELSCLRIGSTYVLHMPGELFVE
ncbi:MAG TPA: hypothetical protein VHV77_16065, partial [Pirellulales bacterium]|nr:hypothetical protein [Pirellulales bacterium]